MICEMVEADERAMKMLKDHANFLEKYLPIHYNINKVIAAFLNASADQVPEADLARPENVTETADERDACNCTDDNADDRRGR